MNGIKVFPIGKIENKNNEVIALSANAFKEDVEQSLAVGMNGHVAKPINVKDLFSVMRKNGKVKVNIIQGGSFLRTAIFIFLPKILFCQIGEYK